MNFIFEGVKVGLIFVMFIGLIFFVIIQVGVEEGFWVGVIVGLGIWVSDFLFIVAVYFGLVYISQVVEGFNFGLYLGIGGSIIFFVFGLGVLFIVLEVYEFLEWLKEMVCMFFYFGFWFKGFFINIINFFIFFFWIGVVFIVVVDGEMEFMEVCYFFGGILGIIIIIDLLKVLLVKCI